MKSHHEIVAELQARWPEHKIGRSLARITRLVDLLGSPQDAYPVIQITGTNGKGSTAIMIEALLRALGLRVGRFSSPHLVDVTERICIDGVPVSHDTFDALVADVAPLVEIVDAEAHDGIAMTFFEVMTALAYEAFAQAPVDVAIMEVGLGGAWDATSVMAPAVAVVAPIDVDHSHLLGDTPAEIAHEKAGIIKEGSWAVLAAQEPDVARVLLDRCLDVGAKVSREGVEFGVLEATLAVGGQVLRLEAAGGPVGDVVLPLFGEHMAHNAALAVASVEAFLGGKPLAADVILEGLGSVVAPARLEVVRRGPTIVLDTAHNPHGARASLAAVSQAFGFEPLIGVAAIMRDKDVDGVLEVFEESMATLVCTQVASTSRCLGAQELAERAGEVFGEARVEAALTVADALDRAVALADAAGPGAGVLVVGSVILAGEARALLVAPTASTTDDELTDDEPFGHEAWS